MIIVWGVSDLAVLSGFACDGVEGGGFSICIMTTSFLNLHQQVKRPNNYFVTMTLTFIYNTTIMVFRHSIDNFNHQKPVSKPFTIIR